MQNSIPNGQGGMVAVLGSTVEIIEKICRFYFNIDTKLYRQSNLNVSGKGSGLILDICKNFQLKESDLLL